MENLSKVALSLNLLFLFACSPLQNRVEQNVSKVDYSDGVDQNEANTIAEHYRINNLAWVDLVGPSDGGNYWVFKLTKAQSGESLESPPVYVLKNAWSLQSAVRFDQSGY